ncbi:MAG: gamma-glutamyltransferase [Burkholderiales bacterium]|nr:gamma-glutamyltransferase [Burkholderiales bacterium]MDE2566676.1 gamma-glutamyltransferase [Burkholderiales bacterium]
MTLRAPPLYAAGPILLSLLSLLPPAAAQGASPAPVAAEHGMVVTAQHLATRVGVDVLKAGGNAIDAAVAVGYALAVVYPAAGNLGGGGFMTIQPADGQPTFLDFREKAPLAARPDMYLDPAGQVIAGASTRGWRAVAVPGTVAGLELARARYGTMPRARLIAPALRYARQGFVLDAGDVHVLHQATEDFRRDPTLGAVFLDHGRPFEPGRRLVQRDLAATLEAIARGGEAGFYRGRVAAAILAASRAGGGLLEAADFERYRPRELEPVRCSYRGFGIVSAPPPSSGGVVLCEMLNILEGYPLQALGWHSAQAVHDQIEAMRHAYADRNAYLGDPDFVHNPVQRLLSKDYAARVRAAIDPARAGDSQQIRPGLPPREGTQTTHYSIVDRWGNAVAVTYTLNNWFGARVMAPGTGVLLNDEMDDFTSKPGVPNLYGLVQGEANAIAPGKTPLSSMCPTIVTRDGKPVMVLGTPGGSRIITAVLLTLVNAIDYGMDAQQAVDAPRFHQQWLPEATFLEPWALSPDTQKLLEGMGHVFKPSPWANHLAVVMIGAPALGGAPAGRNRYYGANDLRAGTGLAAGY